MSSKSKIKAAKKRADRRVASKNKPPRQQPSFRAKQQTVSALRQAVERHNLPDPFVKITDGTPVDPTLPGEDLTQEQIIAKCRESVTNTFRMFSYIAMGKNLADKEQIIYTPRIDIEDAALRLVQLDRRVLNLPALAEGEEQVFAYEMVEIAAEMDALAGTLYSEMELLEEHALIMEAHLSSAVKDLMADPEFNVKTEEAAAAMVLESMAFIHVSKHINVKG